MSASDVEWGEPVWSDDASLSTPPPTAVDWRKSIPREFVARSNVNPRRGEPTNGHSRAAASAAPAESEAPAPAPTPAEQDEDTGTAARHLGANGANGTVQRPPDAPTSGGGAGTEAVAGEDTAERRPPQHAAGATANPTAAPRGIDDTSPWNELDREIARALAATLAGKLARYVHSPILPLVADELTRLLNSPPPLGNVSGTRRVVEDDADDTGEGPADDRPRHFGDGNPQ